MAPPDAAASGARSLMACRPRPGDRGQRGGGVSSMLCATAVPNVMSRGRMHPGLCRYTSEVYYDGELVDWRDMGRVAPGPGDDRDLG